MNERILKYYRIIKDNLAIIIIIIYGISFANYYIYYKSFEIPIFNYIGLNDMIFFFAEYLFEIISIIFLTEIILFLIFVIIFNISIKILIYGRKKWRKLYLKSSIKNRERIEQIFDKGFSRSLNYFRLTVTLISILVIPFLYYKMIMFPAYLIYLIYYLEKMNVEEISNYSLSIIIVIIFLFMVVSTLVNWNNKRFEKDDFNISFYENNVFYTTDKDKSHYNYLGETSTNIFFYDIQNRESVIFVKENISYLKIKNSPTIDNFINSFKTHNNSNKK